MDPTELLGMSDEDFEKLGAPPVEVASPTPEEVETANTAVETSTTQVETTAEEQVAETQQQQPAEKQEQAQTEEQTPKVDAEGNPIADPVDTDISTEQPPDYKALYEGLIKPLKANGKEIQLHSHDELIQLAQQGANYTRKMQQLAPHRKTLQMLENNDLLDPTQLGFLIDLHRKDPAAIQKFLKDSGVNPLDVDIEAEPTYQGGNHQVTDAQVNFRAALDDARSSDTGMAVLQSIDTTWDQASKELLFKEPSVLATMVTQHEEGFYTRIVGEMDRRRMLGRVPAGQTWLETYKEVGMQMSEAGHFNDLVAPPAQQRQTEQQVAPVATRVVAPKPQVTAADKAAAAAPSNVAARTAQTLQNPLEMSDEEFMKKFANRL